MSTFSQCNLRSVDETVFAKAVLKLKVLKIEWSKLTREQTSALFTGIAKKSSLEELAFVGNHVDHVQPAVIGRAVGTLTKVTLENSWMSVDVFKEIFENAKDSKTLQEMNIGGDSFGGDLSLVRPEVFGDVISRLRSIRLKDLTLSQDQCMRAISATKQSPVYINVKMFKVNILCNI